MNKLSPEHEAIARKAHNDLEYEQDETMRRAIVMDAIARAVEPTKVALAQVTTQRDGALNALQAQSEDTARLDWLEKRSLGFLSDAMTGENLREAIDAARKEKA